MRRVLPRRRVPHEGETSISPNAKAVEPLSSTHLRTPCATNRYTGARYQCAWCSSHLSSDPSPQRISHRSISCVWRAARTHTHMVPSAHIRSGTCVCVHVQRHRGGHAIRFDALDGPAGSVGSSHSLEAHHSPPRAQLC